MDTLYLVFQVVVPIALFLCFVFWQIYLVVTNIKKFRKVESELNARGYEVKTVSQGPWCWWDLYKDGKIQYTSKYRFPYYTRCINDFVSFYRASPAKKPSYVLLPLFQPDPICL
jgi:hypothetical protein